MGSYKLYKTALFCLVLLSVLLAAALTAGAADKENCLMCHKYPFIGRIDENGKRHNYHVQEDIFAGSVHRAVACRDCHTYITKIPHDPVTEEVNCANLCHIKPPFTTEKFSHKRIIDLYNNSVHGIKPDDSEEMRKAKPYCKYCHLNPIYTRVAEERIDYHETLGRCLNCHQEKGVTQAYKHMTHRLRKKTSRSSQEIVALCAKCHQDKKMMAKLDASKKSLTSVETYKQSLHGKSVTLGSQETADCISCHASSALHDIYAKDDVRATVHPSHISETCQQCHAQTNSWFIQIAVHPTTEKEENPIIYMANIGLRLAMYGSVFGMIGLMLFETFGRRKEGIKWLLKDGSTWRIKKTTDS